MLVNIVKKMRWGGVVLRLFLKAVLLLLVLALLYVVLKAFGISADNLSWFTVGVFKEYAHIFQHPITLLIIAIFVVIGFLNVLKRR